MRLSTRRAPRTDCAICPALEITSGLSGMPSSTATPSRVLTRMFTPRTSSLPSTFSSRCVTRGALPAPLSQHQQIVRHRRVCTNLPSTTLDQTNDDRLSVNIDSATAMVNNLHNSHSFTISVRTLKSKSLLCVLSVYRRQQCTSTCKALWSG